MKSRIVFTGLAFSIAGTKELELDLPETATYRDVVRRLATDYPEMVGILIAPDRETFLSSTMFIIDGDLANPAMVIDERMKGGENLHLMSVITGG